MLHTKQFFERLNNKYDPNKSSKSFLSKSGEISYHSRSICCNNNQAEQNRPVESEIYFNVKVVLIRMHCEIVGLKIVTDSLIYY